MKAVVLLSGGLDSTTVAFLARASGFDIYALTIRYGQRHERELSAARDIAKRVEAVEHRIVALEFGDWGSSLTGSSPLPTDGNDQGIPSTWVPMRNLIFLGIASAYAEVVGADAIYIGVSQVDYSGYPDCRAEFIAAYQRAADMASKQFIEQGISIPVVAPLMHMSKPGTISLGWSLGIDYDLTWSCYEGGTTPCGICDSCRIRSDAFEQARRHIHNGPTTRLREGPPS